MGLSYEVSRKSYLRALKRTFQGMPASGAIVGGLVSTLLVALAGGRYLYLAVRLDLERPFVGMLAGMTIVFAALSVLLLFQLPWAKARRALRGREREGAVSPDFFGIHTLAFKNEELTLTRDGGWERLPCRGLRCERAWDGGVLLYAGQTMVEYLPRAAFGPDCTPMDFAARLRETANRLPEPEAPAQDVPLEDGAESLNFDFTWTKPEFIEAFAEGNRLLVSGPGYWTPGKVLRAVLGGVLGLLGLTAVVGAFLGGDVISVGPGVFLLALGFFLNVTPLMGLPAFSRSILRNQLKRGLVSQDNFAPQRISFTEKGCISQGVTTRKDYLWPQISRCESKKGKLFLFIEGKWILLLPPSAFPDEQALQRAEAYVKAHMT